MAAAKRHGLLGLETLDMGLAPPKVFARRLARTAGAVGCLITFSLLVGMSGYHSLGELDWIDAFHNAAMILSGMGPVDPIKTVSGKLFAGCFAIYSGLVLIIGAGALLAPLLHRMMHRMHLDTDEDVSRDLDGDGKPDVPRAGQDAVDSLDSPRMRAQREGGAGAPRPRKGKRSGGR